MAVPLIQQIRVGTYVLKQRLIGVKRYPLVLMLEPLFRCNLACLGCGKIDYEDRILDKRLSVRECLDAVDECGAPVVSIPGGEPLIHPEMKQIVEGIVARKKFVYLCTNALLLAKKLEQFTPSPYLTFSIHLDGLEEAHDRSVAQKGTFKRAVAAIKEAHISFRERKVRDQVYELPSIGSTWKNPPAPYPSAWLIVDEVGMRGAKIGGAQIAERHSNFIVNIGGARADDVLGLMAETRRRAREHFGLWLEPEIHFWGFDPERLATVGAI